jgi:hypothetical protein
MSFGIWGDASTPGEPYYKWFGDLVASLPAGLGLQDVAEEIAQQVNALIGSMGLRWSILRRGIHVAGFEDDLPCIFHVHTGAADEEQHELRVFRDYPDIHGGGRADYARTLQAGGWFQLRNGRHDLLNTIGAHLEEIRREFKKVYGKSVPGPDLAAQFALDRATVHFCAGLLASAGAAPSVSEELDGYAFGARGLVTMLPDVLRSGRGSPLYPIAGNGGTTASVLAGFLPIEPPGEHE